MKCLGILIRHHSSAAHEASQHCWGNLGSLRKYKHCARLGTWQPWLFLSESHMPCHTSLEPSMALSLNSHLLASPDLGRAMQQESGPELQSPGVKGLPSADLAWMARAQLLGMGGVPNPSTAFPSRAPSGWAFSSARAHTAGVLAHLLLVLGVEVTAAAGASWQFQQHPPSWKSTRVCKDLEFLLKGSVQQY